MILAKVIGPVIATIKNPSLKARSIFVVKTEQGKTFLALDSVQANPGDTVLITQEGNSCRQILKDELAPVNSLITGIVDTVDYCSQVDTGKKRRSS
ncbi:MAG: hypothetical protein A2Z91_08170 [Deltaproteobacteria bacterium GWA2_38_16]|nr:MAG: hypothetical protein A2Z91_08170 [Deltaproteobacteria bacterium GWA2_38_16]OGQ01882.1 MAG: hypothetical protein A3D19_03180 [Deltaproteobacteria bacterium RIFCSPHIGHO2_02_FULL_38_15]OGQ29941.1 MAG: hypothetical protein A3A72_05850 [Deltaproteobacteria bacterium RIFCSPLOWO2_01_FULL_38_9]OGQ60020.1 MAG: hypothetical protein A3G92_04375 [Deltaproteobacteria bacterium RIFCSPLOWO2_12_FULL_38_8]HBQ20762.1 hypothetical protein [Deltaproteobacteria bacterium]